MIKSNNYPRTYRPNRGMGLIFIICLVVGVIMAVMALASLASEGMMEVARDVTYTHHAVKRHGADAEVARATLQTCPSNSYIEAKRWDGRLMRLCIDPSAFAVQFCIKGSCETLREGTSFTSENWQWLIRRFTEEGYKVVKGRLPEFLQDLINVAIFK